MTMSPVVARAPIPFDTARLDALLDAADIDVLIATSKHNVQYLLGGYRFFFFDYMDAIGLSRYLPVLVYPKGRPDAAAYVGYGLEKYEKELGRFWTPVAETTSRTSAGAMQAAVAHLRETGLPAGAIGIEAPFLPLDAADVLRGAFGGSRLVEATVPLERLRARKTAAELTLLREASERVVASMQATFAAVRPGMTKHEIVRRLREEEVGRGLVFEYCLITAGRSLNRAPSDVRLAAGDILSLDSGGNYGGYIGDLCRMGILGRPDAELRDLLGEVDAIQQAARRPIRAGGRGGDVFAAAQAALDRASHCGHIDFLAHGMGLVSHEAPRLTSTGPVPYPGYDVDRPLETGMVISIETTLQHPVRGFIKLEDTVAVTADGCEGFGDTARGWNVIAD
ncbi:aminopeptidase P family protein [Bradyrhizobium sp. U87765 SZCCT0131]|uniref:M24 family metallopeptidase n=1 Tax=unclassified Bradyrhizobium TaxID=2631580 RepID=UPI001BA77549|nr:MULTISPECIES: Xaa-Pro peptidase family protein [unclassified Bradyrhizobium]MBR1221345.1 aminopeptidase P family protein [Bradyrhizobium sp. U87765 SZCCT0131]MBR1264732.1 aminopeptidase P family protein [Bradyrhizobium sp. U87765 SZCCT0134]MBR1304362.1 aminopeptidase P family protein [Bradyrhizobium sp. U87765 SZCCT0110]MBR1322781.1 aminopeptidase P family protein [Bradyrhizobium sp. U87765 SZCCT0109]MBR1346291.1 aminopeptidase P family protein [Bradyrhizobium sp. U87765 SZCCT0048]